MGRFQSYINTAEKLIHSYIGEVPFAVYIKSFFSGEKKYGSRDRKQIANLCYQYFRVAIPLKKIGATEPVLKAAFLCSNAPNELIDILQPEWSDYIGNPVVEKMAIINSSLKIEDVFPYLSELSSAIETGKFCLSFLHQPNLFIRMRQGQASLIVKKLEKAYIPYTLLSENCLQLPPACNTENIFIPDKEAVVQDYNSQQVLNFLNDFDGLLPEKPSIWDCCAASGGKSMLAFDIMKGKCDITVSDIRPAIISNLHHRFKKAGIKKYHYFISDIEHSTEPLPATVYDIIICDAPCTGSGTWSRTPEQLCYFDPAVISTYVTRQTGIIRNTIPHLKKGGLFVYITCSVFKKENEEIAALIEKKHGLHLLQMQYLPGYTLHADSMFTAVFQKP